MFTLTLSGLPIYSSSSIIFMKKILLFLLFPIVLTAQNKQLPVDAYMQAQAALFGFNGNVLLAKNGRVIYQQSFGYADYSTGRKLDSNSVFDCGSIAKEFTAMGILLLKDKGKLSITDTLGKFLPQLPYTNITIGQLLTHTSGMPDGFGLITKFFDHTKIATNDDLVRLLASEKPPLYFKPGESLAYSGTAFNLLASIIEKITGQPYKTYMYEKVFKPLGMAQTQVANGHRSVKGIPGLAHGYLYSDSLKKNIPVAASGWTSWLAGITGEGMIITTTGDMYKWDRALKAHTLLTAATQAEMLTVHSQKVMPKVSFGYGMRVGANDMGDYVFHNGWYPGYVSMHLRYTSEDVTAIVLSNNESHADFIADALCAIATDKDIIMPYSHKEAASNNTLKYNEDKYLIEITRPPYMATYPVEFIKKEGRLYIHPTNGNDIALKAETALKFFYADGTDQQIEFEKDSSGNLAKVWHTAWGVKKELKKMD